MSKARTSIVRGASNSEILMALEVGKTVKGKPEAIQREAADLLTGTNLLQEVDSEGCRMAEMNQGRTLQIILLIAVGAAMAANCERCLNQAVPGLIEEGVSAADIRRAVEIGQAVKGRLNTAVEEIAAELLSPKLRLEHTAAAVVRSKGCGCA